ncbi:glycoside hydrolase family 5 protein [Maribacter algarum]|uniref:Glycoside hydrolase family 5 protein n=1 Tax=Maribacter algarum (ex Zhang et al. 2020) TaxID=2578118 RepID=A0A5S3PHX1_9FLAO|nr:glycoside hydrolase family 5 protein [Maribacter algarum]TMM53868.1 glycoside hydrolase family 5 protein [Maribacter algarum]
MRRICLNLILVCLLISTTSCSSSDEPVVNPEISEDQTPKEEEEEEAPENPVTASSIVDIHGQLSVSGKNLVDKDGNIVQLRGMSLSWTNWWPQFYTKEVVQWLKKDFKATIVRASMGIEDPGGYLENKESQKALIFTVIDAAIEEGLYVVVDWHSHHAEDSVEEAKIFFTEVAQKYGDQPNIIYETYNEPLDTPSWNDVIKPYHEAVIAEIRKYDPDNVVIAGTRTWSQRVDEVIGNQIEDDNVMYTLHYYASSHKQELRDLAKTAIDAGIPLFVTEQGVTEYTGDGFIDIVEANTWWDFLDENNISWLNWSIADKEESSAAVKPGASGSGEWPDSMLTQSGLMVREELRGKNPN